MRLDGNLTDPELTANLLVQETRGHQHHDLTLALRERLVELAKRIHPGSFLQCPGAAFERMPDGVHEHVVVERLGEELGGSSLHRLDTRRNVAVSRDEDDWHLRPIDRDALLNLQTVDVR